MRKAATRPAPNEAVERTGGRASSFPGQMFVTRGPPLSGGVRRIEPERTIPGRHRTVNPPLRRTHSDHTLEAGANQVALEYWRKPSTADIVNSLQPRQPEALTVTSDGRIMNGNTRVKVLAECGFDVNSLPQEGFPRRVRGRDE
jgi:hypothetical protein